MKTVEIKKKEVEFKKEELMLIAHSSKYIYLVFKDDNKELTLCSFKDESDDFFVDDEELNLSAYDLEEIFSDLQEEIVTTLQYFIDKDIVSAKINLED